MNKRQWLLSLVIPSLFGASQSLGCRSAEAQTTYTDQTRSYRSPMQSIDERARAENPSDANSVYALIDAILDFPNSFGRIPPIMREIVEQRLVQAEISYKLGRNPGIPEKDLVQIANTLADKLKLSDTARTSLHQVEVLRFGMELSAPDFMTSAASQGKDTGAFPSAAELSPAQATHILLVLITQNMINPDFQLPLEEWEKTKYQPAREKMRQYKELRDSGQLEKMVTHAELVTYPGNRDLRTQIYNAVSQMSITDGLDLVNQAFGIAGISK